MTVGAGELALGEAAEAQTLQVEHTTAVPITRHQPLVTQLTDLHTHTHTHAHTRSADIVSGKSGSFPSASHKRNRNTPKLKEGEQRDRVERCTWVVLVWFWFRFSVLLSPCLANYWFLYLTLCSGQYWLSFLVLLMYGCLLLRL